MNKNPASIVDFPITQQLSVILTPQLLVGLVEKKVTRVDNVDKVDGNLDSTPTVTEMKHEQLLLVMIPRNVPLT